MVGNVFDLGRVKQGNCHTNVLYTIPNPNYTLPKSFHKNLSYPPPYFGYPDWKSVTLCKYQHYPTLDNHLSLSFHSDTLPEYLRYPTNRRKNTPPNNEYLSHLTDSRHLSLNSCNHFTIPFITYPNLHSPTLYYCKG